MEGALCNSWKDLKLYSLFTSIEVAEIPQTWDRFCLRARGQAARWRWRAHT